MPQDCDHPPEAIQFVELIDHPVLETPQNTYKCEECGAIQGDGVTEEEVVNGLKQQAENR